MGLLRRKKKEEEENPEEGAEQQKPEQAQAPIGDASVGMIAADLGKLKAQFSSFYEMQKASTERFTRINEQIGELRAMMLEREKSSQLLEAKATQSIDLVQSIQPDKFMVELRKMDFKSEALKAHIESNENVIQNAVNEIKDMRAKINSFKGIDEVIKLNLE